ncbi:MAG: mechanosensitive ion channel [Bacteroidales bacterium]|nr:mechanosensitive ion channel [Bacteroidales bacterium]
MELNETLEKVRQFFLEPILTLGSTSFSLWGMILFFMVIALLFVITGLVKRILVNKILTRYSIELGVRQSIGSIFKYITISLGLFVIVQSSGIDLSAVGLLFGALGVGIGFGLQNITNNFISGLVILFSRPIKVGDRVEVGNTVGDVVDISARATTLNTNDNITIIVPNSEFISNTVINWSHNDRNIRYKIPVGVSYKEDPAKIKKLLLQVAREHPGVLTNPPPDVQFHEYGDSSLNFLLLVWTTSYINRPFVLRSDLYYAIFEKFKAQGVEIPYPQRDLHLKSGFEPLLTKPL